MKWPRSTSFISPGRCRSFDFHCSTRPPGKTPDPKEKNQWILELISAALLMAVWFVQPDQKWLKHQWQCHRQFRSLESIETCQNVSVNKLFLADAVSDYGYCFGVHIAADDSNITVQNALICNMDAPNTVASATTDKGDVFGIEVTDNNGPILIKNVVTKNLTGGGSVLPFPSASSSVVLVNTVSY